jgi:hypothetical protein
MFKSVTERTNMRQIIALGPLFWLSVACMNAQTMPVLELSKEESARAQTLHERMLQTEKDWGSLRQALRDKYVEKASMAATQSGTPRRLPWFPFMAFSSDFRLMLGTGDPTQIVELAKADTAEALAVHSRMIQAQQDWEALRTDILRQYVYARKSDKPSKMIVAGHIRVKRKFEEFLNFRFTQDYRFITTGGYRPDVEHSPR